MTFTVGRFFEAEDDVWDDEALPHAATPTNIAAPAARAATRRNTLCHRDELRDPRILSPCFPHETCFRLMCWQARR